MIARMRLRALINSISMLFFFVHFFTSYLLFGSDLVEAFIRGVIVWVITAVVLHALFAVWAFAFSPGEWRIIIDGPPRVAKEHEEHEPQEA